MGILGSIKNRFLGRNEEDYDEIRSRVLGDDFPPERPPPKRYEETPPEMDTGTDKFGPEPNREPMDLGGPLFTPREEKDLPPVKGNDYEIVDRLNFIENQLSAIKSQTETINERLKNLEMKLGRRY